MSPDRRFRAALAWIVAPSVALAVVVAAARSAALAQPPTGFFPDIGTEPVFLESAAAPALAAALAPHALAPAGQIGDGRAGIEVANPSGDDVTIALRFFDKADGSALHQASPVVPARASAAFDLLALLASEAPGRFGGELEASRPVAALARGRWSSGAAAAYSAVAAARDVMVPLFSVAAGGPSSLVFAQNGGDELDVEVMVHDPQTGGVGSTTQSAIGSHQVMTWDAATDTALFGPHLLPPNAAGGFVGPASFRAPRPIAVLSYVDVDGPATAALAGRGRAEADRVQVLPRLRAAADGGSLVAIANASPARAEAAVTFRPLDGPPMTTAVTIAAFGAAYLDLSGGGRTTVPAAALPAVGFMGSAVITANQPILAAAIESWHEGGAIQRLAAYNAFGPRDLSAGWDVPVVRRATDYVSTELIVHNPGPAAVTVDLAGAIGPGDAAIEAAATIAAGAVWTFDVGQAATLPVGLGRAALTASGPVAVLVHERRDESRSYPIPSLSMHIGGDFGSDVAARAVLRQVGDDVEVAITQIDGENNTYSTYIQAATCDDDDAPAKHNLADVAGGRSTSRLNNVELRSIADGQHAIRLRRGRRRVACGIIPELRGVESADHSLVAALPRPPGPAMPPTAAPPATPTDAPPTTSAPTATAPTEPAATPTAVTSPAATDAPATATAVVTAPAAGGGRLWLPIAHRGEAMAAAAR